MVVVVLQSYARLDGDDILGDCTRTSVIYTYSSPQRRCGRGGHYYDDVSCMTWLWWLCSGDLLQCMQNITWSKLGYGCWNDCCLLSECLPELLNLTSRTQRRTRIYMKSLIYRMTETEGKSHIVVVLWWGGAAEALSNEYRITNKWLESSHDPIILCMEAWYTAEVGSEFFSGLCDNIWNISFHNPSPRNIGLFKFQPL
jgi:hypothetical protein